MKKTKLFFTIFLILISSLLYSQKTTETLLHLEYNIETKTLEVVEEKITYDPQRSIVTENNHTEAGLPLDSNGYPIVVLEPEQSLVQQEDSTTLQQKNKINKNSNDVSLFWNVLFIIIVLAIAIPSIWTFFRQLKEKNENNSK